MVIGLMVSYVLCFMGFRYTFYARSVTWKFNGFCYLICLGAVLYTGWHEVHRTLSIVNHMIMFMGFLFCAVWDLLDNRKDGRDVGITLLFNILGITATFVFMAISRVF